MNTQLSVNTKAILTHLLAGPASCKAVAGAIGLAVPVVSGSLAGLKKGGFVEILPSKELSLTMVGIQLIAPDKVTPVKVGSKGERKAAARKIVDSIPAGSKRAVYMKRFMDDLGISSAGASTYHYNHVGKNGKWKTN